MEILVPVAANTEGADITEVSLAALALGMVFVGTCNDEVTIMLLCAILCCDWLLYSLSVFLLSENMSVS
jgi:hypothetical protein